MTDDLQALLRDLDAALEDWSRLREPSYMCSMTQVMESQQRMRDHGGTLAYIAALRERIKEMTK